LLVKSLAQLFDLKFQRIQFTPDLMPADITGTEILQQNDGERRMAFVKGPIFANMILADEINRTPPKTQAAMLEAMQEHHVTAAGVCYRLDEPFFVFATQKPHRDGGHVPASGGPARQVHVQRVHRLPGRGRRGGRGPTDHHNRAAADCADFTGEDLLRFHAVVRRVPIAEDVVRYAVRLAAASRPSPTGLDFVNEWITWGAGLRASQYMVLGAKARALLYGRSHANFDDIKALALPVLAIGSWSTIVPRPRA